MNKQNQNLVEIECPEQRIDLISFLKYLADPEFQGEKWLKDCYRLDSTLDYFYNETDLSDEPHELIGVFLKSKLEADSIKTLINIIEPIRLKAEAKHGELHTISRPSDVREFIDHPDWNRVIATAKEVLNLVLINDRKQ